MSNWNRVYPNYNIAFINIRNFVRDGQRLGSTGVLNTTWDDDGEALFNQVWAGVWPFGAAAGWQSGESSIDAFQRSYGRAFYRDTTGRADAAERLLMAAHATLQKAGLGEGATRCSGAIRSAPTVSSPPTRFVLSRTTCASPRSRRSCMSRSCGPPAP